MSRRGSIRFCSVPGCDRVYSSAGGSGCGRGMCAAHYARWRSGSKATGPIGFRRVSKQERLVNAALRLADAEGDREYRLALWSLLTSAREYAKQTTAAPKVQAAAKEAA